MRLRSLAAAAAVVFVAACTDANVTNPPADGLFSGPSFAISDAGNGGAVGGFWFLPPIAKQVTTTGTLDPNLQPSMEVCELTGNPSQAVNPNWQSVVCATSGGNPIIVTRFAPGSATLNPGASYQFSWNTGTGPQNLSTMDPSKFYRIHVLLSDVVLGYLDVNPQNPSGQTPGEDYPDLYAFRLGENLPVKVFITPQARCALSEGYVIQCAAQGVIDDNGGVVTLESTQPGWSKLSTVVPAGALPPGYPTVTLTMERIDPVLFRDETGEECIPGIAGLTQYSVFDAPQFGDCLRVTTDPILPVELEIAALVEMCIDPFAFSSLLKFAEEQDTRIQIIRYDDGVTQGLPNVDATTCAPPAPGPDVVGFFPIPREDGLLRTAAIAANTVGRWLAPTPLVAHGEIRLAGQTTEFSRFRWALPGQMTKVAGDGTVIQKLENGTESYGVTVKVKVVDSGAGYTAPSAVADATVHYGNGASPVNVTTGADGIAQTTWTVPSGLGVHTLNARALGLLSGPVPDHNGLLQFVEESVTFSATVVGPPSSSTQSPASSPPLEGTPGSTLGTPLTITVLDANGNPVVGWPVTWTTTCSATNPADCNGYVTGGTVTDANGQATGSWTLATTPGLNTVTATVGTTSFGFTAGSWSANGRCLVTIDGRIGAGEWDCGASTATAFLANISGGSTPAEVRWQRDGTNLYMLVKVRQSSLDKVNSLRVDFDNVWGSGASADDDAIGFDAGGGGFFDQYLTSGCVNRSQSGCGAADTSAGGTKDGAGALGNDGTHTIYELRHPLVGNPGLDFALSANNPEIGFFLTLRVGNGAQGNTQFPGFRNYLKIRY